MNQRRIRTTGGTLPPHIYNGSIDCFVQVYNIKYQTYTYTYIYIKKKYAYFLKIFFNNNMNFILFVDF